MPTAPRVPPLRDRWLRTLTAAACLAGVLPASGRAQTGTAWGPTLGVNFSTWSTRNVSENIETRTGVVAGFAVNASAGPRFSVQSEVLYAQKGARVPLDADEFTYRIDWIQVPVLAQIRFPSQRLVAVPYLLAGPAVAWRARCTLVSQASRMDCEALDLSVKELDVTGIIGVGVVLGPLSLSARYDVGFTNISGETGETVKSRVITLMMGLLFGRDRRDLQ